MLIRQASWSLWRECRSGRQRYGLFMEERAKKALEGALNASYVDGEKKVELRLKTPRLAFLRLPTFTVFQF